MVHETGTLKGRESTMQPMSLLKKEEKKEFTSIRDRFLKYPIYRRSQIDIERTEEHCAHPDEIAAEDHSYIATAAEGARHENTWVLVLHSSGPNGPMNQGEDY